MIISPKEAGIHAREESMMPYAGLPAAETPAPSSHNTSITDAVMSLPDLLRARSAPAGGRAGAGRAAGQGELRQGLQGCAAAQMSLEHCIPAHFRGQAQLWLVCSGSLQPDLPKCAWE